MFLSLYEWYTITLMVNRYLNNSKCQYFGYISRTIQEYQIQLSLFVVLQLESHVYVHCHTLNTDKTFYNTERGIFNTHSSHPQYDLNTKKTYDV